MTKKVILTTIAKVSGHDSSEKDDKEPVYSISFKSLDGDLIIGLKEAVLLMKVKAKDDIIKANFPMGKSFEIEISDHVLSEPEPKKESVPQTLDDALNLGEDSQESEEESAEEIPA